jgi:cobalt/nickel transport system permease protein
VPGLTIDHLAWASPWRERSVRDKAALALGLLLAAVILPPLPAAPVVAGVASVLLLGPIKVTGLQLVRVGWAPAVSILIGMVTVVVSVSTDAGLHLVITEAGLAQGTGLALRATAATLAMLVLACSTPVSDIFSALRKARVPDPLVEIASLVYRLTAGLLTNARAIQAAQVARLGYANRRAAMRSASMAAGVLFLRSWDRAQRLEDGMAGRGYVDKLRTLEPAKLRSARFLALTWVLLAAVVGVSIAWEVLR